MAFIGGTNLRLVKGIDRFSEDLDFDCKDLSKDEFIEMTNGVIQFLERSGLRVEAKDKDNPKLSLQLHSFSTNPLVHTNI